MPAIIPFNKLGLNPALVQALTELGYENPTPVQSQSIPMLLEGKDLLAQAQTGTGKTGAFALPVLSRIDLTLNAPQVLVIAPTRELAIQVAEAFQSYSKYLDNFHVAPIYGGQEYRTQLRALQRGSQVIVGTPGRVMDHMRRGSLVLDKLQTLVLDEADEMLKMGFIDDIEWILQQIPAEHQTALFSATMPPQIQKIANRYLKKAEHVHINPGERSAISIEQSYMRVSREQKMDVLTAYLEVEEIDAAIIFTRTKTGSAELAEKLQARGYSAAALNGDIKQSLRKQVIDRIKSGKLDIIVATDVAARGIDVERVSHVINFDIPHDTESYIHRIGRTGRAGRKGKALLMITPREQRLLKDIEFAVKQSIPLLTPPSRAQMSNRRSQHLAKQIAALSVDGKTLTPYLQMVDSIAQETGYDDKTIAATLAYMAQESNPLPDHEFDSPDAEKANPKKKSKGRSGKSFGKDRDRSGFSHRKSGGSSEGQRRKPSGDGQKRRPSSEGQSRRPGSEGQSRRPAGSEGQGRRASSEGSNRRPGGSEGQGRKPRPSSSAPSGVRKRSGPTRHKN